MMKNSVFLITSIIVLPLSISSAYANKTSGKWYIGADIGSTNNNIEEENFFTNGACARSVVNCSYDDSDSTTRITAGYNIRPNVVIELSYADLGETAFLNPSNSSSGAFAIVNQDSKALSISAIGKKRLGHSKASAFGKLGISYTDSEISFNRTPDLSVFPDQTQSKSNIEPLIGLGLEYNVNDRWNLRAGWDRYFSVGERQQGIDMVNHNIKTVNTDVDVLYLGATASF